jgi:hypothetical protein
MRRGKGTASIALVLLQAASPTAALQLGNWKVPGTTGEAILSREAQQKFGDKSEL